MVVCILLNVVAVKFYGESEFFMSSTKVFLLIFLMMITITTMSGANPARDAYGFRNWQTADVMHPYVAEGSAGRFLGWWSVVLYAAFSTFSC
jgi:yeast amino acid transporter